MIGSETTLRTRALRSILAAVGLLVLAMPVCAAAAGGANAGVPRTLTLKNDLVLRELEFDGHVWRTTRFARADGREELKVRSDEFHILFLDETELTLDQYAAAGEPVRELRGGEQRIVIRYVPRAGVVLPTNAPSAVTMTYWLEREPYLRKTVALEMKEGQAIDRLEVERFSVSVPAARGGRGEPVFINRAWFFGVEYPAFYSRHTDGNTPAAYSGPYDRLGNYSFIDLQNRDVDRRPRPGLVRLMHFPGNAKKRAEGVWGIVGKTAVAGLGRSGDTVELAFLDYLDTIRRPVRSFIHYNNWYDPGGKRLTADNFVTNRFLVFKQHLDPYGVRIDAMVPDDGWQNRRSVYEPSPAQFPGGMDDLAALSQALQQAGTHLGLWIALNGYNSDIEWGRTNGFVEAERNKHFSRFRRYYSITQTNYHARIRERLTDLITRCQVGYFKHDFNEMCELNDGCGHLPTDRHGHEAAVDAELELLALERERNRDIYQNITNWIWFSPWWLAHGNNLWMLSGDSGEFRDWPELSLLVMAAAYRDVNLHPAWHDPGARPLVPISHLMTHGIIYTDTKYSRGGDTLREFADFVMMYYMRGLQLKEWYINPRVLTPEQWDVLGRATRWSEEHVKTLANAVMVGGNPGKGEPYGYVCWNGDEGILSVRNPAPAPAGLVVPFDQSVWYRGTNGRPFHADVVYPYQETGADTLRSGEPIRIRVPGYTLLVMHLAPGRAPRTVEPELPAVNVRRAEMAGGRVAEFKMPDEAMQRSDLLVISRGGRPEVSLDNQPATATRTNQGRGWQIASFDLQSSRGKNVRLAVGAESNAPVECWLVLDRPVPASRADADARLPFPVSNGFRRQTVPVFDAAAGTNSPAR